MCLPNFIEFKQIEESNPVIGYRSWINEINNSLVLKSINQNYEWNKIIEGPHEVLDKDSGIYSYNNNYYNYHYCHNYYYNYNYNNYKNNDNYYNYNYNNYHYYNNLSGIIHQWGKVAIHKTGYRSEFAKIITLFTIRESDAIGSNQFLDWIKKFNSTIKELAEKYQANTIHWQDFLNIRAIKE